MRGEFLSHGFSQLNPVMGITERMWFTHILDFTFI